MILEELGSFWRGFWGFLRFWRDTDIFRLLDGVKGLQILAFRGVFLQDTKFVGVLKTIRILQG